MVFSSLMFLCVFGPLVLILYNLSKNITYKNIILVAASLFFYAWGEAMYIPLLLFAVLAGYGAGLVIDRYYARPAATAAMILAVIVNLGLLGVFKYADFFVDIVNNALSLTLKKPSLALPLGISFFTFQTLSYIIDVYRGRVRVQRSLLKFAAYVSMFPQLVAGPIVRYTDIAGSLSMRRVSAKNFSAGAKRFAAGLCKKVVLANNAGEICTMLLGGPVYTTASSWLGIIMYTFQIYFDFSGYSDMAIGLGKMLGFDFPENFEYPYISKNITEFWRRWHISLSSFFRDYVYIPLGGNRRSAVRNLFVVWALTGLWHGASWNFIIWGLFYGVLLFLEKFPLKRVIPKLISPFCHIYTMFFVIMGWGIFYFTDIGELWLFLQHAFGVGCDLYDLTTVSTLCTNLWFIVLCLIAMTPIPSVVFNYMCKKSKIFAVVFEPLVVIIGFALSFVLLVGNTYNPFLYFRF
ncbi:MAG: MBOAT family protein [Clostridiales bacterium]|nr:MBOAT family protein [Clostridiales bacterium]